jgi:hypothetical protein
MNLTHHRFRQVHLDFHTALECGRVAQDFDPRAFVETLQMGRVDTINIFAKCHHGYSYYPTKVGAQHPGLSFDLLGSMIEHLHKADIRCPIYVSVKWDDLAGMQHPEWVCARKDGALAMRSPLSGEWGWTTMDIASGYADYFVAQVEELIALFGQEIDGFWFDICFPVPNYSPWGMAQMRKAGVNLADEAAVWRYARQKDLAFFERVTRLCQQKIPQATIYYNGTTTAEMGEVAPYVTHFEVESLPTSGEAWGYLHYPIVARQARTYGKEIIGMTGRFHRSWADFGGLKTQDQLDYECGTILAAGGKVCVGDQLHPRGVLDPAVYRLLGRSFARVAALEPWLEGAVPQAEAAILALGRPAGATAGVGALNPDVEGAAQVLLESGVQFDIVDESADLSRYPLLILPHEAQLTPAWREKLSAYLLGDGKLVASGSGGLDLETGEFLLPDIPVQYLGPAPTVPSYLRLSEDLAQEGELATDYDYVFYDQAYQVKALEGAQASGQLKRALFNRTWEHFTSHRHAPVGESLGTPLVVRSEKVLYFAAPLFAAYRAWDYWAYRAIAVSALRDFLPRPLLKPRAPGWVEMSLHNQPATAAHPARKILHVVAYHPRRSLQTIPHVDQSFPTAGLGVGIRLDGFTPTRAYLAPDGQSLEFHVEDGYVHVDLTLGAPGGVSPIGAHAVVVVE